MARWKSTIIWRQYICRSPWRPQSTPKSIWLRLKEGCTRLVIKCPFFTTPSRTSKCVTRGQHYTNSHFPNKVSSSKLKCSSLSITCITCMHQDRHSSSLQFLLVKTTRCPQPQHQFPTIQHKPSYGSFQSRTHPTKREGQHPLLIPPVASIKLTGNLITLHPLSSFQLLTVSTFLLQPPSQFHMTQKTYCIFYMYFSYLLYQATLAEFQVAEKGSFLLPENHVSQILHHELPNQHQVTQNLFITYNSWMTVPSSPFPDIYRFYNNWLAS